MIRRIGGRKVFVSVVSSGRPGNVLPQTNLIGPATWVVPPEQVDLYSGGPAADVVAQRSPEVTGARNTALELAFRDGVPCIQVDDDLIRIRNRDGTAMLFVAAWSMVLDGIGFSPFRLAGFPPTDNPYFSRGGVVTRSFVCGSAILVLPTELRFDDTCALKEDYDYTAQHIVAYGGVYRCEDVLWKFAHYENRGGAVDVRTPARESAVCTRLKEKWPGWFRDNPRRSRLNELLFRPPRNLTSSVPAGTPDRS